MPAFDRYQDHDLSSDVAFALDTLVRMVERKSEVPMRASVLLLAEDRRHLLDAAGPSLPDEYRAAIHGLAIGPKAGSCGTAAHRNERVIVADIQSDPLWEDYRHLAKLARAAACWSEPIRSSSGEVVGTFAMYHDEPHSPSAHDVEVIETAAAHAGLILERARGGARREALLAGIDQS